MTKKIFKGIVTVSALTMLGCFVLIMGVLYEYFGSQLLHEMKNETAFIAQGVEQAGENYLENLHLTSRENRITWIGDDGTVLYDSEADASQMENHAGREEVQEALQTGEGSASRYSDTLFEKTVYYAKLLEDGSVIRISSEQNTVWTILLGTLSPIVFVLVAMLVLALVLSSRISKRLVKPINEIDLNEPEITEPYEELAPLLAKINSQNRRIKRQIEEIRKKQDEFNIITENMSEGFLVLDHKADILSYNSSALRLMGVKEVDVNKSVLSLNRSESFRKAVELALSGKHNEQMLSFGDSFYNIIANPVYHEEKLTGVILVILDATEKECREKLRREFTSNVSHGLKTPLTTIYGVSDMLTSGLVKPEDVKEFAKTIKDESGRLITLIEDIINLSQLDEESIPQADEKVDIYDIAADVVHRLESVAAPRGITLSLQGEHAVMKGSRSILDEMLYNLCDNAIKYNRENGAVRIGVENNAEEITVTVEDTGIGIPSEHINRVFERFYRVDKSHSKKIGGTGLGLSIVKHAASYHGGTVKMESEENKGTKVTVKLPKA